MKLESILEQFGFGRFQVLLLLSSVFIQIPSGLQNTLLVFIAYPPKHQCDHSSLTSIHLLNTNQSQTDSLKDVSGQNNTSLVFNLTEKSTFQKCQTLDSSYYNPTATKGSNSSSNSSSNNAESKLRDCNRWVFDNTTVYTSLVTQFILVCDREFLRPLLTSTYFFGFMSGCLIIGQVTDYFGRYKAMIGCMFTQCAFTLAASFSPNYVTFSILRWFVGLLMAGAVNAHVTMLTEIVASNYRSRTIIATGIFFALGYSANCLIGMLLRNHQHHQWCVVAIGLFFSFATCLLPESPRWLILKNRERQAMKVLKLIAKVNRQPFEKSLDFTINRSTLSDGESSKFTNLFRLPNVRRVSFISAFIWFSTSFVYYGMIFGFVRSAGDFYLNSFYSALIEIPAVLIILVVFERVNHKAIMVFLFFLTAASSICLVPIIIYSGRGTASMVVALIGRLANTAVFSAIYLYTLEVFPTIIRTSGLGWSSTWARIGTMVQPQITRLSTYWIGSEFIAYFVISLVSGILLFFVSDVMGHPLPETLEEADKFHRLGKIFSRKKHVNEHHVQDPKTQEVLLQNGRPEDGVL